LEDKKSRFNEFSEFEEFKFARELLSKEIQFRRERQWQVFTWTSSILVGIIVGVIAINGTDKGFVITTYHKWLLCFAVCIIAICACYWLAEHTYKERRLRAKANQYDKELGLDIELHSGKGHYFRGYILAIVLMAIAALATILLVKRPSSIQLPSVQQTTPPPNNSFNPTPQ
jgi:hypothetical protein